MKFISQFSNATRQLNVLTDGEHQCAYQSMPSIFDKIKNHLATMDISIKDCLAFECDNSVPSALFLLYMLEEGYSFLLLPKEQSIPKFCQYLIRTERINDKTAHLNPEQFLHIFKNDDKNGTTYAHASQKLYLRTSGSTGTPKIAVHSHTRLRENVLNCVQRLRLNSDDRIAIPAPLFHMYGLGAAFLPAVAVNASIDLQKGANLLRYLQREKKFNPNVVFMTPVFCETLLKGRKSPRTYKLTITAGDRFRGDTFTKYESLCGCLVQLYGSTEMGAIAAASPDTPSEIRAQTVGKPMQNVQMRVEKGPDGTKDFGELWCYHQSGFEGYVDENGNPISLGQEYREGWFRTKDFGRIWPESHIEVLGRCDHSVNRDGLLVFFADVEKAIETIEGIDSAVVISKGESQRGKRLIAYCVPAKGVEVAEKDIRTACFDLLSRHAIPDQVVVVNSLPLLANGKVDRQKLINLDG
jgi:acyl-CoA synthetase (AMP-forming)/AMP-acid ligase II